MKNTQIHYLNNLPSIKQYFDQDTVFFYDSKLDTIKPYKKWIDKLPYKIALKAGEGLKTLPEYGKALEKVQKIITTHHLSSKNIKFVAIGGGSVGDFVGFLASTFQRGKAFYQIPTTWLSAIDSAHGGKNGLNLKTVKNQIGTFYEPDQVFIMWPFLTGPGAVTFYDAYAEAVKISLINKSHLLKTIKPEISFFKKNLHEFIKGKYQVVKNDPFELNGHRRILNLGHTMGHVFEVVHGISHGQAIYYGLLFTLRFSLHRQYIDWADFNIIIDVLFKTTYPMSYQNALKMTDKQISHLLKLDKKNLTQTDLDFIFIKKAGQVFRQKISFSDLMNEVKRQRKEL